MKTKETLIAFMEQFQKTRTTPLEYDVEAIGTAFSQTSEKESLTIKILSVFGGLISSLAFIAFIFTSGFHNNEGSSLILGLVFLVVSLVINKASKKIITDTISISMYAIGIMLLAIGLNFIRNSVSDSVICLIFTVITLLTLLIANNFIWGFVATLLFNVSIYLLFLINDALYLFDFYNSLLVFVLVYLFLNEAKIIRMKPLFFKLYQPVRTGFFVSYIALLYTNKSTILWYLGFRFSNAYWLIILIGIGFLIWKIMAIFEVDTQKKKLLILGSSCIALLPMLYSNAILSMIFLLLLSFYVQYRTGIVLSILGFVYFLIEYYYQLSISLLHKSLVLIASGIMFLVLYYFISKKWPTNEKTQQ